MAGRRITTIETECAQGVIDETREYMGEFFPGLNMTVRAISSDTGLALRATIDGGTDPYSREEVVDSLSQLGVENVVVIDPNVSENATLL
ncbi:MAG: hypothetical protein AAB423_02550 [Patescibacteria group bacterium]